MVGAVAVRRPVCGTCSMLCRAAQGGRCEPRPHDPWVIAIMVSRTTAVGKSQRTGVASTGVGFRRDAERRSLEDAPSFGLQYRLLQRYRCRPRCGTMRYPLRTYAVALVGPENETMTMADGTPFQLAGAAGEVIRGNLHVPVENPGGRLPLVLVLHGFKGYKDYGFFPYLTQQLANTGLIAARLNFSHCGIDEDPATFGRPDLFEKDTWSKQLEDVQAMLKVAAAGQLPHADRIDTDQIGLVGHSRGGTTALLAAGHAPQIAAVVAMAAPAMTDYLSEAEREQFRAQGYLPSPSARTGQQLRIGRQWLDDLQAHPDRLDLAAAVARIQCPLLILHGAEDATVPVASAKAIAAAYDGTAEELTVDGANHTFNCANPMTRPSPALDQAIAAITAFLGRSFSP